ncbi:hypothetical protein JB92DRAFT_3117142 [Gautieria morchelliformis]|nr:hypothetical protein JB92DRAFT_3117142 [Gautieria morchelliformis]
MGASRLPQELIDDVTDNLHEDCDALLACSLVCRSWLPSSQRHIFRRVTFVLNEDRCDKLAQALLNSPHLSNYTRELQVRVRAVFWQAREAVQSLPAAVIRKLSKLRSIHLSELEMDHSTVDLRQSLRLVLLLPSLTSLIFRIGDYVRPDNFFQNIHLCDLSMDYLTVDLCQSLRRALLLPSLTSLTLYIGLFGGPDNFLQELLTRGDQERDEPRERSNLSHLDLELAAEGNLDLYVDWFLGPRSPFKISHIQDLRINHIVEEDEKALNRLLRTIGGSLKQVEFCMPRQPYRQLDPKLAFDVTLGYNSNIRFLSLINISIWKFDAMTLGPAWLLGFLSNIDASNKIEQIHLEVEIDGALTSKEVCSAAVWGQVDCILAEKFRKLEQLEMELVLAYVHPKVYSEIEECVLDAHPLLVKRGVSVAIGYHDDRFVRKKYAKL